MFSVWAQALWQGQVCHITEVGTRYWVKQRTCTEERWNPWLILHCLHARLHAIPAGMSQLALKVGKLRHQGAWLTVLFWPTTSDTETTSLSSQICSATGGNTQPTAHEMWLLVLLNYTWKILLVSACLIRHLNTFGIRVLSLFVPFGPPVLMDIINYPERAQENIYIC